MESRINKTDKICITVRQINILLSEKRVVKIHSAEEERILCACDDGLLRMVSISGGGIDWLDSWDDGIPF